LLVGIDDEIQYYAEEVRRMSRPPNTEEVMREDDDSSLPYDPNLVCPKCGKQYRIGQIQRIVHYLMILIWCALNVANNIVLDRYNISDATWKNSALY
jgi:hypothetical protein